MNTLNRFAKRTDEVVKTEYRTFIGDILITHKCTGVDKHGRKAEWRYISSMVYVEPDLNQGYYEMKIHPYWSKTEHLSYVRYK